MSPDGFALQRYPVCWFRVMAAALVGSLLFVLGAQAQTVVTTFAGIAGSDGSTDGTGTGARFDHPWGMVLDGSGNLYVADASNNTIRKISTSTGVVTTFAGLAGSQGSTNGTGNGALFHYPTGLARDASGNLYVADYGNELIRKITTAGVVSSIAGSGGSMGSTNGTGTGARFSGPYAVAVDSSGNLYVADSTNCEIRKVTTAGVVTTFAGTAGSQGSKNGTGTAALFKYPFGIAIDAGNNLYVADTGNQLIRKITTGAVVTTLAGTAGSIGSANGTGTAALFYNPNGLAVDANYNVYVADTSNNTVRKITSAGVVTTIAGYAGSYGSADGTGTAALFYYPRGIAVDASGNVWVGDTWNYTIRN